MNADLEKLQGAWSVITLEVDGQTMPAAMLNGAKIVVEGDRFQSIAMGAVYEGAVKVNSAQSPKTFDLRFTDGPEKGNTNFGIYELDADTWKMCLNVQGKNRPAAFASAPGSGNALQTLRRANGAAPAPVPSSSPLIASGPPGPLAGEWSMVSCFRDGHALDPSMLKSARRVASGEEAATFFGPSLFMQAKYMLDPSQSPHAIDYAITAGMGAGQNQYGIYELDGELLKLCFAVPGGPRPADFISVTGDQRTVTVWRRGKRP